MHRRLPDTDPEKKRLHRRLDIKVHIYAYICTRRSFVAPHVLIT